MNLVILVFPDVTQLDFTAPLEILSRFDGIRPHIVWKDIQPVRAGDGLQILPSVDFASCPPADILLVPGGRGQLALMEDEETLNFLRLQAKGAKYITSVCTGSLVLAAAGLLGGYRATSHWQSLHQLALFGAEPVDRRIVIDGNRITAAGVTAGLDFALQLGSILCGEEQARRVQLAVEYDPQPPFDCGSRERADRRLVAELVRRTSDFQQRREQSARRAALRLGRAK